MAGITFCVCLVLVLMCKSSLANNLHIQKELEVIKGQIEKIVLENKDLKNWKHELEHKVLELTEGNLDLNNKLYEMTKENSDLKRRTIALERKVKYSLLETSLRNRKSKFPTPNKNHKGVSPDKGKVQTIHPRTMAKDSHDHASMIASYLGRNGTDQKAHLYQGRPNLTHVESSIRKNKQTNGYQKDKRLLIPTTTTGTQVNGPMIAFSATVKHNLVNVGIHQEIPFETVENNIGEAYHPGTGTFSCPQNGVYAFFVTILAFPNIRMQVEIVKDGVPVAHSYSRGDSVGYGSGSLSAIVRLQKGDRVWVREVYHVGTGNMIDAEYSSFMGFSLVLEHS